MLNEYTHTRICTQESEQSKPKTDMLYVSSSSFSLNSESEPEPAEAQQPAARDEASEETATQAQFIQQEETAGEQAPTGDGVPVTGMVRADADSDAEMSGHVMAPGSASMGIRTLRGDRSPAEASVGTLGIPGVESRTLSGADASMASRDDAHGDAQGAGANETAELNVDAGAGRVWCVTVACACALG